MGNTQVKKCTVKVASNWTIFKKKIFFLYY